VERKVIEEIRNILEWGCGVLGGVHKAGCCGIICRGVDARGCFLLRLPRSPLGAAVDFSSGFLGLAVSVVAITVGFAGAFVT